jgi:uroporphyrinogen decarboxylase
MNKGWTSRKRVQAVLEHTEPDRIPIGLPITVGGYKKLRQYLGFAPTSPYQSQDYEEAQIDPEMASFLGIDLAWIFQKTPVNLLTAGDTIFFDEWHVGRKIIEYEPGLFRFEVVESPLAEAGIEELKDFHWPVIQEPGWVEKLEEDARHLYSDTDLALVGRFSGSILETARNLRGDGQWRLDLAENPDFVCALLNRIAAVHIAADDAGIRNMGKFLSMLEIREPLHYVQSPEKPLFSSGIWQQNIKPILERRWQTVRQACVRYAAQIKLMFSASIYSLDLLQEMVESGVNILGALQPDMPELDFFHIKQVYGDQISFFGGIDPRTLQVQTHENDVRKYVRNCISQLGSGGGYILAPSQMVKQDALPQNILAMCETAKVYGRYPSG